MGNDLKEIPSSSANENPSEKVLHQWNCRTESYQLRVRNGKETKILKCLCVFLLLPYIYDYKLLTLPRNLGKGRPWNILRFGQAQIRRLLTLILHGMLNISYVRLSSVESRASRLSRAECTTRDRRLVGRTDPYGLSVFLMSISL